MSKIELSQLFIYPVKSLAGIALSSSEITPAGLLSDRRWMIVNKNGQFISQRLYPELSLLRTSIDNDRIVLTAPDNQQISLPVALMDGLLLPVKVWNDTVNGLLADQVSNNWITTYLGTEAKFIYMPETTIRPVDPDYAKSSTDQVSFADGFPYLLISESSLHDLNGRLAKNNIPAVPMTRFRPNLVVRGCPAYNEDLWTDFKIANNYFHGVKPCSRCIMTTVDPDTGKKGEQPLKTLMEYRKQGNKAYFGQNVLINQQYTNSLQLRLGDEITIF